MASKKAPTTKAPKSPTSPSAASRVQSTQAKAGNDVGKNSFPARTQGAAAANVNKGVVSGETPSTGAKGGRKSPTKGTKK